MLGPSSVVVIGGHDTTAGGATDGDAGKTVVAAALREHRITES